MVKLNIFKKKERQTQKAVPKVANPEASKVTYLVNGAVLRCQHAHCTGPHSTMIFVPAAASDTPLVT
jgi:hypothetical protein